MLSRTQLLVLTVCTAAVFSDMPVRAEPLPPELNLIPRDAALMVSIRVSDMWNEPRLKPLRDFLVEEERLLRDIEKETGFRPDDIERLSVVCPSFHPRHVLTAPLMVVTFKKPYDRPKLLETFDAMSESEYRRFRDERFMPKTGIAVPKGFPVPPPKAIEDKSSDPPPKPIGKEIKEPECGQQFEPAEQPVKGKNRARDLKAPYYFLGRNDGLLIPIDERTVVFGFDVGFDRSALPDLLAALLKRSEKGPLTPALEAAARKHSIVLGINLPAAKEAIPEKGWVNALPIDSLMKCRSVTATLDFGEEIRLALHVDGPDEVIAKRVLEVIRSVHTLGMESLPGVLKLLEERDVPARALLTLLEPIVRDAKFELKGTTASVVLANKVDEQLAKTIRETIEKLREAAEQTRAQNNLRQLAIAAHNYESAYGRFPFPGVAGNKRLNLSWRVAILPFIEQEPLYRQFKLDEPWDSDHNKKLIDKMPRLYAPPRGVEAAAGHTFYRVFTGPQSVSAANSFAQITDGTSNTLMIVEAGESVPWTKPDDFPYDPNAALPRLGGHYKGKKMHVAMCDGSVRTIDLTKIANATLRALITANGGEVVPADW